MSLRGDTYLPRPKIFSKDNIAMVKNCTLWFPFTRKERRFLETGRVIPESVQDLDVLAEWRSPVSW